jgi:hypothetical protein
MIKVKQKERETLTILSSGFIGCNSDIGLTLSWISYFIIKVGPKFTLTTP